MRRSFLIATCASVTNLGFLFGQGVTLIGSGYSDPSVIRVAPGQIATLFVTGLKTVLLSQPINAAVVPLPTALAGISVTLNQNGGKSTPVPLLSIQQSSVCSSAGASSPPGLTADCLITAITVQIPFELTVVPQPPLTSNVQELLVTENGTVSKAFKLTPLADNLHVINTCDLFQSRQLASAGSCEPLVTHADGTIVTVDTPAQADEELVVWAYGLGATTPTPTSGSVSPTPAATYASSLYLQFDFRTNAAPSRPYSGTVAGTEPPQSPAPIFVGLTPGEVGLYQINFKIPSSIPVVERCGISCGSVKCTIFDTVQSNLTIDIGASFSFDGAAICVEPPQ